MLRLAIDPSFLIPKGRSARIGLSLATLALVLWPACGRKTEEEFRLTDRLRSENVILSPFRDIDGILPFKSQTARKGDFLETVVNGKKFWILLTESALIDPSDLDQPKKAEFLMDGKELPFAQVPPADAWSWRWEKGKRKVNLFPGEDLVWAERELYLPIGKTLETGEVCLPGPAEIELTAESGDPARFRPLLDVTINGERSREIVLGGRTTYRWTETLRAGMNAISIVIDEKSVRAPRPKSDDKAIIHSLIVKSAGDAVLISPPAGKAPAEETFTFRYRPGASRTITPVKKLLGPNEDWTWSSSGELPAGSAVELILHSPAEAAAVEGRQNDEPAVLRTVPGPGYSSLVFPTVPKAGPLRLNLRGSSTDASPFPGVFVDAVVTTRPLEEEFGTLASLVDEMEIDEKIGGEGPLALHRKIKFRGTAYDALLAAPPTELRFPVRVPEGGVLQFGYGLIEQATEEARPVVFEIWLKKGEDIRRLFEASRSGRPSESGRNDNVIFHELDLSEESGKDITLIFRTRAAGGLHSDGRKMISLKNGLAFWASPVVGGKGGARDGEKGAFNVIYISVDTLRADHLGCYGYPKPTSPNIDALAKDGVVYLSNFAPAPYTLTSHMTALTGLDPINHGVLLYDQSLALETPTLAGILRDGGFRTAAFTGGSQVNSSYGFSKGFDLYDEKPGSNELVASAAQVCDAASNWLKMNRESRFFLFLHTYQPHNPYRSPAFPEREAFERKDFPYSYIYLQNFLGKGSPGLFKELTPLERDNMIALYDIEIRYTDEFLIKPLIARLKELGLYDRTMIVLAGDHGEEFFEHGSWEHVHTVYNELIRVPLIVKYPHSRSAGGSVNALSGLVDIVPTVLEEMGVRPSGLKLDGRSLAGFAAGKKAEEISRFSHVPAGASSSGTERYAVIRYPYKLILNAPYSAESRAFFDPPPPARAPLELFDWVSDPLEKTNLADRNPGLVRELVRILEDYKKRLDESPGGRKLAVSNELTQSLRSLGYIR